MSICDYEQLRKRIFTDNPKKLITESTSTLDKESNTPEFCWLLGLAYLLNNQEEEAQSIWSEGIMIYFTEFDLGAKNLCDFLKVEAVELTKVSRLTEALPLWEQILNIDDSNLDAHLAWIDTAYKVDQLSLERVAEFGTIELLTAHQYNLNLDLLLNVTLKVLECPTHLSLDFLQASIPYFQEIDWLNPVMNLANHMAYDCKLFSYAVDIAKTILQFEQNNFYVLNDLLKYYGLKGDQAGTLSTTKQIRGLVNLESGEPEFVTYVFSKLLSACMATNDWSEVESLALQLQHSLNNLLKKPNITLNEFLSGRFWALGFPLLYLSDNPPLIRNYLNCVADIFQQDLIKKQHIQQITTAPINIQHKTALKRIGYIAHTLRKHSVGWLSRWLFKYHDRQKYEIYVYLIGQGEDELTKEWIYPYVDCYYHFDRDVNVIVEQIRADQIQVLVDLDVLTHNITAQVLAHKPAPVQVSWLGSDASGLPATDYFVVDPHVVADNAQTYYRERLWRLPHTYLAVDGFEVGEPTLSRRQLGIAEDTIIYLSVQNKIKSNPHILRLQLQIVQAVPDSVFLIKGGGDNDLLREMVEELTKKIGLDSRCIQFLPKDKDEITHRANIGIADVVLDTYPYNGATTTLETLWMGIPLVTRVGEQFASRNSYAFLTQVGIEEGIAWTDKQYVDWGIRLGQDRYLRQQVRERLRLAHQNSPLWQGERFTKEMEKAFRGMWEEFVSTIS